MRLDPFTIFLDENHQDNPHILKVLAGNLKNHEQVIKHRDAGFVAGAFDDVWLPVVGKNGWIVISTDARIWKRWVLRDVLFRHGVRGFFFTENNLRGITRAEILRKALPDMRNKVRENPPPFVASLTVEGKVHLLFDLEKHKQVMRNEKRSDSKKQRRKGKKRAKKK